MAMPTLSGWPDSLDYGSQSRFPSIGSQVRPHIMEQSMSKDRWLGSNQTARIIKVNSQL